MPQSQIVSTRNATSSITGYRDDLVAGDLVGLSLSNYVGITSVLWELIGRPEGSAAGGAGPEPVTLATANTAAFNADSDSGDFRLDGTYTVQATLNPGSPGQVRITAILCRLSGLTIPGPSSTVRTLRKLGGFEALEDTSVPTILQGWATELNRWLELLRETVSGGAGGFTTLAGAYSHGASGSDQTMVLHDSLGGGILIDGSQSNFTGASALRINTSAGGPVVVDRATGRVGVGIAAPLQSLHAKGSAPAVRLDRTGGAALDIQNVGDELQFLNGATVMAKLEPTGGVRADLGVGIGFAPATAAVLALGPASTAPLSAGGSARFRYNESTGHAEFSENGGAYQPFSAPFSAYQTIDAAGTPLTQRTVLNFMAPLTPVDNSGATRTDVSLVQDGTSIGTSGGALQRLALTGAVAAAAGSGATTFGTAPALSALINPTNATAVPGYSPSATGAGQALIAVTATTLGWADPSTIGTYPALVLYIDNDAGNDANNGTSPSTPVKTFDLGLDPKIPSDGKGGTLVIHALPRSGNAIYLRSDAVTQEQLVTLSRLVNYRVVQILADWFHTGSVPSFGGVTATGTNAAGYDLTGTPTTNAFSVQLHGGGAASLGAEPSLIGYRFRFDAATTTIALRNQTRMIIGNTSSAITVDTSTGVPPVAGDLGFIEMPGLAFGTLASTVGGTTLTGSVPLTLTGLNASAMRLFNFPTQTISFSVCPDIELNNAFTASVGSSVRSAGGINMTAVQTMTMTSFMTSSGVQVRGGSNFTATRFYSGGIAIDGINFPAISFVEDLANYPVQIGDIPGSTAATNNSPSRLAIAGSYGIGLFYSNARIGRVNYELATTTQPFYPVEVVGNGVNVYIDGVTANNSPAGSGGIVDLIRESASLTPSKDNTITFGPHQISLAGGSAVGADIHASTISPADGLQEVQYTLQLDTLKYTGSVTDGNNNRFRSLLDNGFGEVRSHFGLWDPNVIPPLGPTIANDQGRFRVVRATAASPGLVKLANGDSSADSQNLVGVNVASLPDPVNTNYDRYGSPMIVPLGSVVPILCIDSSPTVPGPVWLANANYPSAGGPIAGVVTTVKPASNAVQVGWAMDVLANPFSETTQYPLTPNPNTVTGTLLRVKTFNGGDVRLGGDLSGTLSLAAVIGLTEGGGADLSIGAIPNPSYLKRAGSSVLGVYPIPAADLSGLFYQTVEEVGAALTQRSILNFDGTVVATDSASPARTNVGLPNVGPGAGTIGGTGIASITLDAQGRVAAASTATYLTAVSGAAGGDLTGTYPNPTIASNAVSNAKFRQSAALSVVGNATNALANVADISAAAASGAVLRESGSTLGFGTIATAGLGANVVTYPKMQVASASTLLGNPTGSPANISEITLGAGLAFSGTTLVATGLSSAFYQTFEANGAAVTQRAAVSFSTDFGVVDNSGAARTDVSLANAGAGAGAYGGAGIKGITLDAKGRVTAVTTATYLIGTGASPGTFNNITFTSDGLVTGGSNVAYLTSAFYQTVEEAGSALTQRSALNFDGTVVATDSASPARTNVGLPNVGPGAGLQGGAGITSVTLDAQGRLTAAVATTWPTAAQVLFSAGTSTLPTGDSTLTFDSTAKLLQAGNALAVNTVFVPTNVSFIAGDGNNNDRDRVQFFLGGGTLGATGSGNNTFFEETPGNTNVRSGVIGGIYATHRIHSLTYTGGSGQSILEATALYIDAAPSTSSLTVSSGTFAIHVASGVSRFGGNIRNDTLASLQVSPVVADTGGVLKIGTHGVVNLYYGISSALISGAGELWTSSLLFQGASLSEYPINFLAATATLTVNLTSNLIPALGDLTFALTRNGTIVGSFFALSSSSTIGSYSGSMSTGSGSAGDVYGLYCTSTVGGGSIAFAGQLAFN